MIEAKPFNITQQEVLTAYKQVKANKGTGGIDGIDLVQFEENLKAYLLNLKWLYVLHLQGYSYFYMQSIAIHNIFTLLQYKLICDII